MQCKKDHQSSQSKVIMAVNKIVVNYIRVLKFANFTSIFCSSTSFWRASQFVFQLPSVHLHQEYNQQSS